MAGALRPCRMAHSLLSNGRAFAANPCRPISSTATAIRATHAAYTRLSSDERKAFLTLVNAGLPAPVETGPAASVPPSGAHGESRANTTTNNVLRTVNVLSAGLPTGSGAAAVEPLPGALAPDSERAVLAAALPLLIDARRDLQLLSAVPRVPGSRGRESPLGSLLTSTLAPCFGRDKLVVLRLSASSPRALLQQVQHGENVHHIASLDDLAVRMENSRRLYGLFQPCLPNELLAYTTLALSDRLPASMTEVLGDAAVRVPETQATSCTFYSINSVQPGLSGIDLGQILLKQAVGIIQADLPGVREFGTLSPVPNFAKWLHWHIAICRENATTDRLLTPAETEQLAAVLPAGLDFYDGLLRLLQSDWHADAASRSALERPLMRLCVRYLTAEKKNKAALDPVANFHLRNGALIERLNWLADLSAQRQRESFGLMVNYRYDLGCMAANARRYVDDGTIATSATFQPGLPVSRL
eukprot:TRINITY_DN10771_c0_g1_i1.p1 TRINITY_DN10771_c0_g1~~TRINITY_DN10771_c0_g1_i1.p1  ORF type:complete len:472 (+),score=141.73 TRINITY_DN10771_c0_g1_i1:169-1584(+)